MLLSAGVASKVAVKVPVGAANGAWTHPPPQLAVAHWATLLPAKAAISNQHRNTAVNDMRCIFIVLLFSASAIAGIKMSHSWHCHSTVKLQTEIEFVEHPSSCSQIQLHHYALPVRKAKLESGVCSTPREARQIG